MTDTIKVSDEVLLRPVTLADAKPLFDTVDRNRSHLREWLPWLDSNHSTEETTTFIERSRQQSEEGTGLVMLVVRDGQICGVAAYNWIDRLNQSCEIGYWLAKDCQGRGIARQSTRALVDHAFSELKLNRVNIPVAVENTRSRSIPEGLGFFNEGVTREAEWLYDHFVDHVRYAMLKREWAGIDHQERPGHRR